MSWREDEQYKSMLTLVASLSRLFSTNDVPFIYYRATENLFCKYCCAKNLARDDTAYDALIDGLGIGIKTFILNNGRSTEKIAEFNALSKQLEGLHGEELALKLADFRNHRMAYADSLYGISKSIYHIIGRTKGQLEVFDSPYDYVDKNSLTVIDETRASLTFKDQSHKYTFNFSKSVLMKQFVVPDDRIVLPVNILDDPYNLLEALINATPPTQQIEQRQTVILPLYATNKQGKYVPEKSGLNQWNAAGRKRDPNEVYIPIPMKIHATFPDFFPPRDTPFTLYLPNGKDILSAKVCQDGSKALMSNPNKALGKWILRDVLRLRIGELLTYERLAFAGFDSLMITKIADGDYQVDVSMNSYSK